MDTPRRQLVHRRECKNWFKPVLTRPRQGGQARWVAGLGYKTKPPLIEKDSKFDPRQDKAYEDIDIALPLGESLEDVVARVESTLNEIIEL